MRLSHVYIILTVWIGKVIKTIMNHFSEEKELSFLFVEKLALFVQLQCDCRVGLGTVHYPTDEAY